LLTLHVSEARANSPPGHSFALDFSGLQRPEISFFTAWDGVSPVSTRETFLAVSRREDFWFIAAARSEDEQEIRAG